MTIENEKFEEVEIEELPVDDILKAIGDDPEYNEWLEDIRNNPEPVDIEHNTPTTRLMEW